MSERFVLDAWSILALLQAEEPAALRVKDLLSPVRQTFWRGSRRTRD